MNDRHTDTDLIAVRDDCVYVVRDWYWDRDSNCYVGIFCVLWPDPQLDWLPGVEGAFPLDEYTFRFIDRQESYA